MNTDNQTNDPALNSLYFWRDLFKSERKRRKALGIPPDSYEKKRKEEKLISKLKIRNRQRMANIDFAKAKAKSKGNRENFIVRPPPFDRVSELVEKPSPTYPPIIIPPHRAAKIIF